MRLILLLLAVLLLTGCNIQSEDFSQSKSEKLEHGNVYDDTIELDSSINIETTSDARYSDEKINISYESIYKETEEYFRMFYDKNDSFNVVLKNSTVTSSVESKVKGYFYNNLLLKLSLNRFGEQKSFFDEYYIINSNLIYCTQQIKYTLPNEYAVFKEEYRHYYIINGEIYQLNSDEMEFMNYTYDDNELCKNFDRSLNDILGTYELYNSQNSYFILEENTIFSQMAEEKRRFFINFYKKRNYETKYFTIDLPDNECEFNNITAFYDENHLQKIRVIYPKKSVYTTYEYYTICDKFIYVIVKNDIYNKTEEKIEENFIRTFYEEFFIVEGKVMEYNSKEQDLIESSDNELILTNFNIARDSIETR